MDKMEAVVEQIRGQLKGSADPLAKFIELVQPPVTKYTSEVIQLLADGYKIDQVRAYLLEARGVTASRYHIKALVKSLSEDKPGRRQRLNHDARQILESGVVKAPTAAVPMAPTPAPAAEPQAGLRTGREWVPGRGVVESAPRPAPSVPRFDPEAAMRDEVLGISQSPAQKRVQEVIAARKMAAAGTGE